MKPAPYSNSGLPGKRVVVVGAGFGGLAAARALATRIDIQITLIDRRNYHLFQPLLYQVATAGLSPAEIATPIRSIFTDRPNVDVVLGNVKSIDRTARKAITDDGEYPYDFLILACGAKHSYFSNPEWEEHAPGLKTLEQATEIRRRILLAFENAEKESDERKRKKLLTFVIVGGGPTGVELAGAIAEISRSTLEKDFRRIDPARTRVILIESGSRILGAFSEESSRKAARDLERLGVQLWTSTRVTQVSSDGVNLGTEHISAGTVVWAAGVQPSSLGRTLGTSLDPQGRVHVEKTLQVPGHPEILVIGDQCRFPTADGTPLPGVAPVAMQQGRHAACIILGAIAGRGAEEFVYIDKGAMATIGRKHAVAEKGAMKLSGVIAWLAWLFIHIYYLIGFKNRFFVFLQWSWSYITLKRGARLILDKEWRSTPKV